MSKFQNITHHLEQIQEKAKTHLTKVLVATKCDLKELREVNIDQGIELSQQLHVPFLELSSKENKHVEETFEELGRQCIANRIIEEYSWSPINNNSLF